MFVGVGGGGGRGAEGGEAGGLGLVLGHPGAQLGQGGGGQAGAAHVADHRTGGS